MKENGKLDIVDPSKNISESYLLKSDSHIESAKILLRSGKLEESVSMSYYAMYHCLLALLFRYGIKSENHAVSIILLKELFKENNLAELISFGKSERFDKQYYTDFEITKMDAEDMVRKAEEFMLGSLPIGEHGTYHDEDRKVCFLSNVQTANSTLRNTEIYNFIEKVMKNRSH